MNRCIQFGIVALGGAGRGHLVRLLRNERARVVAVYDRRQDIIEDVLKDHQSQLAAQDVDIFATTDWASFLERNDVQAVSICSPDHLHAEHALEALKRGWHVLCEKPLTDSLENCERILEAVDRAQTKFMVHHQWRYVPTFVKARSLVREGIIGDVFAIEADYYHDMTKRAVRFDNWRMDPSHPQNIVLGGACHSVDLMQWIVDEPIIEVFAYANHRSFTAWPDVDNVLALLRFASGVIGKLSMSVGCKRPQYQRLVVLGNKGTIVNNLLLNENGLSQVVHHPSRPKRTLDGLIKECISSIVTRQRNTINYPFDDFYEHERACEALIDGFLESVLMDKPVPIPLKESVDAIRVCLAIIASYQTGRPVTVER